jgi:putative restriction endonuclease
MIRSARMAFGEIPGNSPGTTYTSYEEMAAAGIHRQNFVGIVGGARLGVESIVLNGGYTDEDLGDEVIYTGFGGQDRPRGRQVEDQEWIGANEGLSGESRKCRARYQAAGGIVIGPG